jgi:serine/threonine protein kinase
MTKIKKECIKGGKVLASGGFGCVFDPALKCEGKSKRESNKVSKLMTEKHATEEYQEIMIFKEKLDEIPNYEDYFLLFDINLCKPAPLSKSDLEGFTSDCTALPKNNITKSNINSKLDSLLLLNMPNGGIALDDFIYENGSIEILKKLNIKLMKLLKHGIVPMNKRNIYHNDIKDSNILVSVSGDSLKTRLIDWGLSTEYKPFINAPFPKKWRNRPLQFNVPFSVVLFSDSFVHKYTKFITEGGKVEERELKPFVIEFLTTWMKERGAGHYKFINEIMFMLFSNDITSLSESSLKLIIETEFTMSYITDYIVEVLLKFTKFRENGTLNLRDYLDNVFIENIDVWGFCSAYFPFLEVLFNNYSKLTEVELNLFNIIKELFVTLYITRSEKLDINEIMKMLKNMDKLFEKKLIGRTPESRDVASGLRKFKKTMKNKNYKKSKTNISFKRKPLKKRFKKPIFLSLK